MFITLLSNKYARAFLIIIAVIASFYFFVSEQKKRAVENHIVNQAIYVMKVIQGDQNAVDEQSNILDDVSILDILFADYDGNNGQNSYPQDSNRLSNANTNDTGGLSSNSRDGVKMVMPVDSLPKQPKKSTNNPKILRCAEIEVILCINNCCDVD